MAWPPFGAPSKSKALNFNRLWRLRKRVPNTRNPTYSDHFSSWGTSCATSLRLVCCLHLNKASSRVASTHLPLRGVHNMSKPAFKQLKEISRGFYQVCACWLCFVSLEARPFPLSKYDGGSMGTAEREPWMCPWNAAVRFYRCVWISICIVVTGFFDTLPLSHKKKGKQQARAWRISPRCAQKIPTYGPKPLPSHEFVRFFFCNISYFLQAQNRGICFWVVFVFLCEKCYSWHGMGCVDTRRPCSWHAWGVCMMRVLWGRNYGFESWNDNCVYVCIHTYSRMHTRVYAHAYTFMQMCNWVCIYIYACSVHLCMHVCCPQAKEGLKNALHKNTQIHMYVHIFTHACDMWVYTYICI